MPETSTDLWGLLQESRLVNRLDLAQLRADFAELAGTEAVVPAERLARWLVDRRTVSAYQARILLSGRAGPFFFGGYQIFDRIRTGRLVGQFRAIHTPTHHPVMLKALRGRVAVDPRQWAAAQRYVAQVRQINDAQLQRVFLLEEFPPHKFLVLEDLKGKSAQQHLERTGAIPFTEACRWIRLAAMALGHLNAQGHVYGDVQPQNLLIEPNGNVKLIRDSLGPPRTLDLATLDDKSKTTQADYMAPELVVAGGAPTVSSDIYALGCSLYELVAGTPPFSGGDSSLKLHRHATDRIGSLHDRGAPSALDAAIHAMTAKEPERRPGSASAVIALLEPLVPSNQLVQPISPPLTTLVAFQHVVSEPEPTLAAPPPAMSATAPPPVDHVTANPVLPQPPPVETDSRAADDALDVGSLPPASQLPRRRTSERLRKARIAQRQRAIVLGCCAAALLLLVSAFAVFYHWSQKPRRQTEATGSNAQGVAAPPTTKSKSTHRVAAPEHDSAEPGPFDVRSDDGTSLWMTPTSGPPLDTSRIAPGAQVVLAIRLAELLGHEEGQRVVTAAGPQFGQALEHLQTVSGIPVEEIDQLILALHANGSAPPHVTCVIRPRKVRSPDALREGWGSTSTEDIDGTQYLRSGDWAYYLPEETEGKVVVMGHIEPVRNLIKHRASPPLMRREMVQLLRCSDRDRHITLVAAPAFLTGSYLSDRQAFYFGSPRPLRDAVQWFLGEGYSACMLSGHLGSSCYFEFRGCGPTHLDSDNLKRPLEDRIRGMPDRVEHLFAQIYPARYWQRVALRLPAMTRFATQYTRIGVEDDQVVANVILPGIAAHNLCFAATMLLETSLDASTTAPSDAAAKPTAPQSIAELMDTKMDLSFAQKSLEFAIRDLELELRESHPELPFPFAIKILGSDLQLEGITRNQQIEDFSADGKSVADILTDLVMRANPVTTVKRPSDPDQKLIWVLGPNPDDPDKQIILVTTRAAAKLNEYEVPAPFRQE